MGVKPVKPQSGFHLKPQTMVLTFEGTEYEGLEVETLKRASIATLLQFQRLDSSGLEGTAELLKRFGDEFLVAWNLMEGDEPLAANGDAMLRIPDPGLPIAILQEWTKALTMPAAPLVSGSNAGESSAVG